jgi:hypothetical protein
MKFPDCTPFKQQYKQVLAKAQKMEQRHHCNHSPQQRKKINSVLLNHRELDFRQTLTEVIKDYPSVKIQKSICEESARSLSSGSSCRSENSPKGVVYMNSKIEKAIDGIIIGETVASTDLKKFKPNVKRRLIRVDDYGPKSKQNL